MKHLLLSLLAASLTACGGGGEPVVPLPLPGVPITAPEPVDSGVAAVDCSVGLHGDSILAGQSLQGTLRATPAAYLQAKRPRWVVEDHARAGQTAQQAAAAFRPATRVVVLEHGTNDLALGTPLDPPLRLMVGRAAGRQVVLTGLPFSQHAAWETYAQVPRQLAQEFRTGYAGWDEVRVPTVDGTHPDQTGSDRLAQLLLEAIDQLIPECK